MEPTLSSHTSRKVVVPSFHLARPTFLRSDFNVSSIPPSPNSSCAWLLHPEAADPDPRHFPILLNDDGTPWIHGNRYLIYRAIHRKPIADATFIQIASDLQVFREILEEEEIDYLCDHQIKIRRPTYATKKNLAKRIEDGSLSQKSANRILSRVVDFYEYLINENNIRFQYTLYKLTYQNMPYEDNIGRTQHKRIRSSDLTLPIINDPNRLDGKIFDGEELKPLKTGEVKDLLTALSNIRNTEMSLASLIALTTGARIQTVFTLRLSCIKEGKISPDETVSVIVGRGTKTNTKYNKRLSLLIPGWLHNRIKSYSKSDRATRRRAISTNSLSDSKDQYLFLTKAGQPYYMHTKDPERKNYYYPPAGGAIRNFILRQLIPELKNIGSNLTLKFHDLRATFGMSIVRSGLERIEKGECTLDELLAHVMMRMGHNDITVTLRYLRYDFDEDIVHSTQLSWEQTCKEMIIRGYNLSDTDDDK